MNTSFSAIIPNYNHGHLLRSCVEAMLAQSRKPDQITIVDDGSTDNSVDVIRELMRGNDRISLVQHLKNRGVAAALNTGFASSIGDIVYFASADDTIKPGFFEMTVGQLQMNYCAGACGSVVEMADGRHRYPFGQQVSSRWCYLPSDRCVELMQQNRFLVFCTGMVWRRNAVKACGQFDPSLRWHTDWLLLMRVAFRYGICWVPETLSEFTKGGGSSHWTGRFAVMNRILDLVESDMERDKFWQSGCMAVFGRWMIVAILFRPKLWRRLRFEHCWLALKWSVWQSLPMFARRIVTSI